MKAIVMKIMIEQPSKQDRGHRTGTDKILWSEVT